MFKNYLKIAWRNIVHQKMHSLINIFGLTIGIACCIVIMLWVQNEINFDRFHKDYGQIFRIYNNLTINGRTQSSPRSSMPLGTSLKERFPEVEEMTRLQKFPLSMVKYAEKEFREENIYFAEKSFFDIFSFSLRQGNPATVLDTANTVVISEKISRKYFGTSDPLGKILKFGDGRSFSITGVVSEAPANSHLSFDFLCALETLRVERNPEIDMWGAIAYSTYIKLSKGTDVKAFENKMAGLTQEKFGKRFPPGMSLIFYLQPLKSIHLYSNFEMDDSNTGDINYVYLFSGIALFILIIAIVNYINLATARYAGRALEVGLSKTLGASRGALIKQFLSETILIAFFTGFLAWIFSGTGLNLLSSITGQVFGTGLLIQPWFLLALLFFTIIVGLISGSYPALFLSSFDPVATLKGKIKSGAASASFRKILVVGQFAIAIALIVGTLTIFKQMCFVRNKHLGFNKEQVLVVSYPKNTTGTIETARNEMASIPGVVSSGISSDVPGKSLRMINVRPEGSSDGQQQLMQWLDADANYLTTLGIEIRQGRNFSRGMGADAAESILINEAAVDRLGWENPIGKTIKTPSMGPDGKPVELVKKVIGVVNDFHTTSLHKKIEPLFITNKRDNFSLLAVKISSADILGTMEHIKRKWSELFPGAVFDFYFLDESFNRQYENEERLNKIFTSFAILAIFISCLGLFGLAAYMTEKRTKEIGIRKVLGASIFRIVFLLSNEFSKWVLIANIIAWPLAYYFMNRWLQTFAYRTTIGFGIFFFSGLVALVIALLTVGYQSIRAARCNPIDSLRYE
jgi:putative ABC transport system permease protein